MSPESWDDATRFLTDSAAIAQILQALDTGVEANNWNVVVPAQLLSKLALAPTARTTVFRGSHNYQTNRVIEAEFIEALGERVISIEILSPERKAAAVKHSFTVARKQRDDVLRAVRAINNDLTGQIWFEWCRDRAWQQHASGGRGLFDIQHLDILADFLGESRGNLELLHRQSLTESQIKAWLKKPTGGAYESIATCFLASALIRGFSGEKVAQQAGLMLNQHPSRTLRSQELRVFEVCESNACSVLFCMTLIEIARQERGIARRTASLANLIHMTRGYLINQGLPRGFGDGVSLNDAEAVVAQTIRAMGLPFEPRAVGKVLPNLMNVAAGSWVGVMTAVAFGANPVLGGAVGAGSSTLLNLPDYLGVARRFAKSDLDRLIRKSSSVAFPRSFGRNALEG